MSTIPKLLQPKKKSVILVVKKKPTLTPKQRQNIIRTKKALA